MGKDSHGLRLESPFTSVNASVYVTVILSKFRSELGMSIVKVFAEVSSGVGSKAISFAEIKSYTGPSSVKHFLTRVSVINLDFSWFFGRS